jgi:hypothetical protein
VQSEFFCSTVGIAEIIVFWNVTSHSLIHIFQETTCHIPEDNTLYSYPVQEYVKVKKNTKCLYLVLGAGTLFSGSYQGNYA